MRNITPSPSPFSKLPDFTVLAVAVLLLFLTWGIFSCFTIIPYSSVGVLTRFGKYMNTYQPGLQFKLPWGIDQILLVEVNRQLKVEFGFGTPNATNPYQVAREPEAESTMVTGDLNMVHVEWVVQYRISDPKKYLFAARDPGSSLRDASESAMREVVGDRLVDEVLTIGRQDVENQCMTRLQELVNRYDLGMQIQLVQLKDVHPPTPVQASFNEVNQAQQEKQQAINTAKGDYNRAVPRARGEADQKVSAAEGYALKRVNEAKGDAERFQSQLTEYTKAPEITRERLYLEAMSELLPSVEHKVILDNKAAQILPLLPLDLSGKSNSRK